MTPFNMRPKLNSIFLKIAAILVVTVGLVIGTVKYVESIYSERLAQQVVAEQALSNTVLVGDIIGGAVKFGKREQIGEILQGTAADSGGQLIGAVVLGADGTELSAFGSDEAGLSHLRDLAKGLLSGDEVAASGDGLTLAVPLRFGSGDALVGVLATGWTPERMLARAEESSRQALLWAGLVFLGAVALSLVVCGGFIVRPLRQFRDAIQALGDSRYDIRIPGLRRGDEIGEIGQSLSTLRDQLEAGQAIQREASFKGSAFMGCSAALMVVDETGTIRYLNTRMAALFSQHEAAFSKVLPGFDATGLVGQPVDACNIAGVQLGDLLRSGQGALGQRVLRLGEVHFSLSISEVSGEDGAALGHVLEWADVTSDLLGKATLGSIEANQLKAEFAPSGELIQANPAFAAALRASVDAVRGQTFASIVRSVGQGQTAAQLLELAGRGQGYAGQIALAATDGTATLLDGSLTTIRDSEGKPMRILLLGRDVTVSEAELAAARSAREEAERSQGQVVQALQVGLARLSKGDLTTAIEEPFSGTYEQLRSDFNGALRTLASAMSGIARSAESIHNEARDISSTADGLSRRTETNSATLEETAAALDTLTTSVRAAASGADRADSAVSAAKTNAENSGQVVLETVSAMDQIADSSEKITSIIKVIDDIAFQTNLLALNAGVEAARAGDAGRGFAVVASEVRALAQRSSNAAREINDLIAKSATQVKTGVQLVGRTGQALRQIVESVSEISILVSEIAGSARQQSASLAEINTAVGQLDHSTQQNAARLEETTAASEGLRQNALSLVDAVAQFRISEQTTEAGGVVQTRQPEKAAAARRPPERALARTGGAAPAIEKAAAQWEDF